MEEMLKKKDFQKDPDSDHQKKKGAKFKPIKVLKRLSHKGEPGKSPSPRKEKSWTAEDTSSSRGYLKDYYFKKTKEFW